MGGDYHTFDLMTHIIFSANYNTIGTGDYRNIMECLAESNIRMSVLWNAPVVKSFRWDKRIFPKAISARNLFLKFVGNMLRERSKKVDCQDVFSHIWKSANSNSQDALTPSQVAAESTTLIVAGTKVLHDDPLQKPVHQLPDSS